MSGMSEPGKVGSVLIPSVRYRDAHAAIDWLERAFGFVRHAVYEGPEGTVAHAEMRFGTGMIMLGSATNPGPAVLPGIGGQGPRNAGAGLAAPPPGRAAAACRWSLFEVSGVA